MAAICGNVRKFAAKNVREHLMRNIFRALWATLTTIFVLTSCLSSDDNDVVTYDDMAITSFALGTLNRYLHTTSKSGEDSVYKVTYVGSNYTMCIDHLTGRIYNSKPLLSATDLKHVVCSLTTKNNGVVVVKSLTSDTLHTFYSTDSIDFSEPREFRVYATNGSGYRSYRVNLSLYQATEDSLLWTEMPLSDYPTVAATQYKVDGEGRLLSSADDGQTWLEEPLGDDSALLPTEVLSAVSWELNDYGTYSLLAGRRAETDSTMTLWRKVDYEGQPTKWVYMPLSDGNYYYLPSMAKVVLVYYEGSVLAIGSNGKFYQSQDQGITWKVKSGYVLPESFVASSTAFEATVADGVLWLTDGVKAWKVKSE